MKISIIKLRLQDKDRFKHLIQSPFMQFVISSTALLKKLNSISGVITSNPVIPVLEDFLFEIKEEMLVITASDLQTSLIAYLPIQAEKESTIAIPSKILIDTLKNLPEQPIQFTLNEESYTVNIKAECGNYRLAGANAADFPKINIPETDGFSLEIPAEDLKGAINQTIFATSNDELRPAMGGVYVHTDETQTIWVATDGHKLVRYTRKDLKSNVSHAVILPRKTLNLLKGLLANEKGQVSLVVHDTNAYLELDGAKVITRLIDERYPNYENVIPKDNEHQVVIERLALLNSLKRIDIYANKTTHQIKWKLEENSLQMSAEDLDFSNEAQEKLACEYVGPAMEIGFNARFLIELLANTPSKSVEMRLSDPRRPVLLTPKESTENQDLLLLIMPVILG